MAINPGSRDHLERLRKALEAIVGRRVTDAEVKSLIDAIAKSRGTPRNRTEEGLSDAANESRQSIRQKAAASDDTDRAIQDLAKLIDQV